MHLMEKFFSSQKIQNTRSFLVERPKIFKDLDGGSGSVWEFEGNIRGRIQMKIHGSQPSLKDSSNGFDSL